MRGPSSAAPRREEPGPLEFRVEGDAILTQAPLLDTDMLKLYW